MLVLPYAGQRGERGQFSAKNRGRPLWKNSKVVKRALLRPGDIKNQVRLCFVCVPGEKMHSKNFGHELKHQIKKHTSL